MKKIFSLLFLMILINTTSSCESDDICDPRTPTTPRLTITFYDGNGVLKNVTNLLMLGEGMETGILYNGVSTIQVPLNVNEDVAKYAFTLNYEDKNPANTFTDILEFNYTRKTIYVSRACGYKINYTLNQRNGTLPNAYILNNDPEARVGTWMKVVKVIDYNIINENETQINIYYQY